jgi:Tat protein translocase TatB subunit
MPNLSGGELLIILLVALIVLGPKRLPEAARSISKGFRELRRVQTSVQDEINATLHEASGPYEPPRPAPAPSTSGQAPTADTAGEADRDDQGDQADHDDQAGASSGPAGPDATPRSTAVFRPRQEIAGRNDRPDDWGEAPLSDETP